ncbi:TRAP transporter permease [Thiorhodospira sibirica]|uniref:TRAP transporter permease n=1 Tax=Thiorhodospira sibirica TaxID=154347 RepID=UPI00022C10F8|nr:TRAP transporter permease [Thiorhodospira sibirica]
MTKLAPGALALDKIDSGGREPGVLTRRLIYLTALAWSLFQLWIASPLPYWFDVFMVSETQARSIHLAFAIFLAFLMFPARPALGNGASFIGPVYVLAALGFVLLALYQYTQDSGRPLVLLMLALLNGLLAYAALRPEDPRRVPLNDWLLAFAGAFCAAYLYLYHRELALRPGSPTLSDLLVAVCGIALLLEATRRVLGPALMIIALVFLVYTFAGPWMPDMIAHRGASLGRAMSQQWLSNEGVFGIALGVSTSFVFLFVLFGALLDKAGAGGYFIRVAFALLGHLRGGPAKAAVVASGMTGLISGSSIANTVTTGTFTVPLMKRVGFPAHKAGAIEVSSSVNGQLMPPVMGAAAFLMVEYVGISYAEVIKHAFLPAVISYAALLYIVHLEALKANMQGLPRAVGSTWQGRLVGFGLSLSGLIILAALVYYGLGWIKTVAGEAAIYLILALMLLAYLGLLWIACKIPPTSMEDGDTLILPAAGPTILGGLHFLLPVVVLIWSLVVERLSPGLSAFWAVLFMIFILLTQRPLSVLFTRQRGVPAAIRRGVREMLEGLVQGARNMIGIGVATAAAGIIVGTVAMTGIGLAMTDFVEFVSGGNLLLMLFLTAFICLILGLGLPTTANYIIVATLMAPVIVELAAVNGLLMPLIAAHLFVFYFGIMADVTPPVGLASFAAAAVSRADPIKTGIQAFWYSLRTVALPFFFVFNPQLLLIGVHSVWQLLLTVFGGLVGMLIFAAATQGYWLTRSRWWESLALLLIALTLFMPGLWLDRLQPEFRAAPAEALFATIDDLKPAAHLRLEVEGLSLDGRVQTRQVMLALGSEGSAQERLRDAGLGVMSFAGQVSITQVDFSSQAERLGLEPGSRVSAVLVRTERPAAQWMYVPALLLLLLIGFLQRARMRS